jgi:hypothetical protein
MTAPPRLLFLGMSSVFPSKEHAKCFRRTNPVYVIIHSTASVSNVVPTWLRRQEGWLKEEQSKMESAKQPGPQELGPYSQRIT